MSLRRFKAGLLPVGGISILLAGALIVVAVGALKTYRRSMIRAMESEGIALMDAVVEAARNTIEAQKVVENFLSERLLSNAILIDRLGNLTPTVLADVAHANGLLGIDVINSHGGILVSSKRLRRIPFPKGLIDPILKGEKDTWAFLFPDSITLGVALRREWGKGIILLYADLEKEEAILKSIGLGNLVREMGREPQMVYILFQNPEGILYATENVRKMSKISDDPWILKAIGQKKTRVRRTFFNGEEVLEVVSPFFEKHELLGVFRMGLSMKGYHNILRAGSKQLILLSLVLLILVLLLGLLWIGNQSVMRLEKSYAEGRRAFEEVMGRLPVGVILIDEDMKITGLNRRAKEIIGLENAGPGALYKRIVEGDPCLFEKALFEKRPLRRSRVHFKDSQGKVRILSVFTSPLKDNEGKVSGAVSVLEDITESVILEDRLLELEKLEAMGELAAGVAHDIRNPLNSIAISTQRVKEEAKERLTEEEIRLLEQTRREVFRLEEALNRFLSLATPLRLKLSPGDPNILIKETVDVFRTQAEGQGVQIFLDLSSSLRPLPMDKDRVKEALGNLVKNALEVMPDGGKLYITSREKQRGVEIRVRDTGPGVKEEDIERIFRPYFTKKPMGTGMGLSNAYRIALLHGGTLSVESRQGEGATFILFLPYEKENLDSR